MRLLLGLCFAAAVVGLTSPASAQRPAPRIGLFIGNANYPDSNTPLPAPIKDVRALAEEFRRFAFETEVKENAGKEEMRRAIDAFTGKIGKDSVALVYFGGFGVQIARQTYLVPVNAQIWSEADARREGISVESIVAEMHRKGASVKVIIVDAAYRNPFERRFRDVAAGLAALDAPANTLVIYSAAPGRPILEGRAENSVFATELLKELRVPGHSAELVFNETRRGVARASNNEQVPWVASTLVDDFSFHQNRQAAAPTPSPTPAPPPTPSPAPAPPPTPPPIQKTGEPPVPLPPVAQLGTQTKGASIKELFEKYDLLGTFAQDCGKPVSGNSNWYFVNRLVDGDRVQRDLMTGPTTRQFVTFLDRAEERDGHEIFVSGTRDGTPVDGIWILEKGRMRQWEASRGGRKEIVAGRYVSSGVMLPWLFKCAK
jgi:hypothetical protein